MMAASSSNPILRLFWARLALVAVSVLVALVLAEFLARALASAGHLEVPPPVSSEPSFWDPDHQIFGVWHRPLADIVHTSECFEADYQTNSIGARDAERSKASPKSRVIVLGDSFIEGWGLSGEQRVTNLLERATGLEHLNLGMSHFGPYQDYLAYKEFGGTYDHNYVLVGIVPYNDFFDLDYETARHSPAYEYRFRPYLVGEYPNYREVYYREGPLQRFARRHFTAYNALSLRYGRLRGFDITATWEETLEETGLHQSYFYDFSEAQFDLLRYSLEGIIDLAEDRRVAVVLIPTHRDFIRYYQSGESRLYQRLIEFGGSRGLRVIDLLPVMAQATPEWNRYFFTCDYHWNETGNQVAAGIVLHELRGFFY